MTRREFQRTVVGAIVGTSTIPEFGKKPEFRFTTPKPTSVRWDLGAGNSLQSCLHPDISIARKLYLKEQWA